MDDAWITKAELARQLGLVKDGQPQTYTIGRKVASGEWPSQKVLNQVRFSPEDVQAIKAKLAHPACSRRAKRATGNTSSTRNHQQSEAASQTRTSRSQTAGSSVDLRQWDLEDRPIRTRGSSPS